MHNIQIKVYPNFLRSTCFRLYASMIHLSFQHPHFVRNSFVWLKVSNGLLSLRVYSSLLPTERKLFSVIIFVFLILLSTFEFYSP